MIVKKKILKYLSNYSKSARLKGDREHFGRETEIIVVEKSGENQIKRRNRNSQRQNSNNS